MVEFEMRLGVGTEMLVIIDFVWFLCPYRMKTLFFSQTEVPKGRGRTK